MTSEVMENLDTFLPQTSTSGKEKLDHMANKVFEIRDTFFIKLAPQIEHMANEVMKNLDAFFLELAT